MNHGKTSRTTSFLLLAVCLISAYAYWHWALQIYAPASFTRLIESGRPFGNNSDLYPRWLGSRELLLHGRDPYSSDVTRDIQIGFYGRPLDPHKKNEPIQEESFVYPVYTVFLFVPTIHLPFSVVQKASSWILPAAIALTVPLWMYGLGLRIWTVGTLSAMLLAVSSAPAVMEYFQQNLTPAVVLFLAAAAASVARRWLVTAGVFLALATMKPDIMVIVIPWFLFWAAARWRERGRLIWSFAISMTVLVASAEVLSPGWPTRFLMALRQYPAYGADPSIVEVLLPWPLAKLCSLMLLISLAAICWRWRKAEASSEPYGWMLVSVCTVTLAVIPKLAAYNGILLLPALIWLVAHYRTILSLSLFPRAMTKATFACVFWAWPSAVALALMNAFFPRKWTYAGSLVPAYTWLALTPLTMIAVIAVAVVVRGGEREHSDTVAEAPSR